MNEQIKVLMMVFQIKLDEKVSHMLLDVLMDQVRDILKRDPKFFSKKLFFNEQDEFYF
jgi:hypothetical protein